MNAIALLAVLALQSQKAGAPFRLPDSLVAGSYYVGDGVDMNSGLLLTTAHTFLFGSAVDTGARLSYKGRWSYDGDVLVLEPDGARPVSQMRFIPVAWGQAVCLVEENTAPGFFASRPKAPTSTSRYGSIHYRKLTDKSYEAIVATGEMAYPDRFSDFVKNGAVVCDVVAIDADGMARLVAHRSRPLQVGMILTTVSGMIDLEVTKLTQPGR